MNNISDNFTDNIKNFKPVLFHWLDGLLKSDVGNNLINTYYFISKLPYDIIKKKKIKISMPLDSLLYYEFTITDLQNKDKIKNLLINKDTLKFNIGTKFDKFDNDYNKLLDIFNFNIIYTSDEDHAISFLTLKKNDKLYIYIINSGEGIESNIKFDDTFYSPHQVFIVCDDINNSEKLKLGLNKIIALVCFYFIYTKLINLELVKDSETKSYKHVIDESTLKLLKFIIENCPKAADINYGKTTLGNIIKDKNYKFEEKPIFTDKYYLHEMWVDYHDGENPCDRDCNLYGSLCLRSDCTNP
jgi:hypothetical protein